MTEEAAGSATTTASGIPKMARTRMAHPNLPDGKPAGPRIVGPARIDTKGAARSYVGPGTAGPKGSASASHAAPSAAPAVLRAPSAPAPRPAVPAADPAAAIHGTLPRRFDAETDEVLVCRQVRQETHDVKTFVFAPAEPRLFRYKPGQFLTFEWPVGPEPVSRCYTLASTPTRPDTVQITVKRVPGGPVSNWLHDTMAPGMSVRALGPMGEFTCSDDRFDLPAPKYLFLSGGSGITPLMSMSRAFHDLGEDRDIVFVHAARTPVDIVFRDELALIARAQPRFRLAFVVESDAGEPAWAGHRGRLSLPMLAAIAPDFLEREVFTCGPAPFMAAVRRILADAGFDMARYHEESFAFEELGAAEATAVAAADAALAVTAEGAAPRDPSVATFRVEFTRSGRTIDCPADTPVLTAARLAGLRLPASCTKGLCGTCKSKVVSGKVEMHHAGGIRQREIDEGLALLCCAKPLTDLVVER